MKSEVLDKIYVLKAGEKVFSIALQENIRFEKDVYVKITNTIYNSDDCVFGNIQLRMHNLHASYLTGKDMTGFIDTAHGDISVNLSQMTPYGL
jgi:hypothetical protein